MRLGRMRHWRQAVRDATAGSSEAMEANEREISSASTIVGGRVLACFHNEWEVALDSGRVERCSIRARHFLGLAKEQKVLVAGDLVDVALEPGGPCVIERRLPRETTLSRLLPGSRRPKEQVIVANVERLVAVASLDRPRLNLRLLDRFLVIAEDADLESIVVLNKTDLVSEDDWGSVADVYERAGYPVVPTSAIDGSGVGELVSRIKGRFCVFAGPSGAGKSSLLNAIQPGLGIRVREVSRKTGKGKHTTTNVTVFQLDGGALVADTPGFRELGFWRIRPGDLDQLFPEFREHASKCRFRGCNHVPEPGCAVKDAVAKGEIDPGRYESYLRLLDELGGCAGRSG